MSSLKDGIVILLKIVGILIASLFLLLVAAGVWMWHSGKAAEEAAQAFCAPIAIGEPVSELIARADRDKVLHGKGPDDALRFRFPGWGMGVCDVHHRDGKVVSKQASFQEFD